MIRHTLKKIVQWAMKDTPNEPALRLVKDRDSVSSVRHYNNHISFNVYTANGGHVIECTTIIRDIDRDTDRHASRLYIIPENENFEKNLGEIITLERLKTCH